MNKVDKNASKEDLFKNDEALRVGLSLSGDPKQVRISVMVFLHLIERVLHADGVHPWQLAYLITAIRDLDRGIVADWLRLPVPATKQEPGTVWEARAALVVALETRMALGETREMAAVAVARAAGYGTSRQLIEWRKQFGRRKDSQVPCDGAYRRVLKNWRAELEWCDRLDERRTEALQRLFQTMVQYARHRLADQLQLEGGAR